MTRFINPGAATPVQPAGLDLVLPPAPVTPLRPALPLALLLTACAGAPPAPPPPPHAEPPPPTPVADASASDADTDAPATSAADAAPPPSEPEPAATADAAPPACPDGMALVDGDYCTELETTCLKSTYAKQNDKTICWHFERPTKCTGEKVHKRFCMDVYEYPNKKGERPQTMSNFPEAQRACAAQGKRVCTETEWTMACEGPEYLPYPYGYDRDPKKCNGDRPYIEPDVAKTVSPNKDKARAEVERLYQGVPSGSQPDCVSPYGVADMPGNADELAASETFTKKSPYDNVTTGGPWLEGVRNQCRPKIYTHNEGFKYYYLSFRCCAEPDGKPTDPRSPKQIKRGQKWNPHHVSTNSD